jgi:hypothetical protein
MGRYLPISNDLDLTFGENINDNFTKIDNEFSSNSARMTQIEQDSITRDNDHKNSTSAHKAEHIPYTGSIVNVLNVKAALEALLSQLNNLVGNTGNSNSEIVDGRMGADNVARATLGILIREMHAKLIDADRVNQIISHGLQVINASQNSPVEFEIQGRTLVNLLGYDGNSENASVWNTISGTPRTVDTANVKYGNGSLKISIPTGDTSGSIRKLVPLETNKYYLLAGDVKNGNAGTGARIRFHNGTYKDPTPTVITDTTNFKFQYIKITPADIGTTNYIYLNVLGTENQYSYFDGIRLYEITAEEYNKIGVEWNEAEVEKRFPYVDAVQHLQNVAVIAEGENLLPPFSEWNSISSLATVVSPYELSLTTSGSSASYVDIPVISGKQYTFSCTKTNGGQHYVEWLDSNKNVIGNTGATIAQSYTVTVPVGAVYLRYIVRGNGTSNTFIFTNPILNLGNTAKPFVPRNPSYLFATVKLGQLGTVKDSLFKQDGQWLKRKLIEKDIVLDGSLGWSLRADGSGQKVLNFSTTSLNITPVGGNQVSDTFVRNDFFISKYNGSQLKNVSTTASGLWSGGGGIDSANIDEGFVIISASDSETGFGESYLPNADEIKAYFNGWQAKMVDANGKPTAWRSLVDGTDAPTQTLAYVSANKAPNYTPYKLSYVLATPQTININHLVEGDIAISGTTQVEVTSGVIVREKVVPTQHITTKQWFINEKGASTNIADSNLRYRTEKVFKIYRNSIDDSSKWKLYPSLTNQNGTAYWGIENVDYDPTAEYTVTYLVLDRHSFTVNATEVKAFYETSPKSVQDKIVEDVTDLETAVSILIQANADLYKRVKALGG